MKILWSPDLSLALPALNLEGPQLVRSLEGDDLSSYCAARLISPQIEVFKPGDFSALSKDVRYVDDGIPNVSDELLADLSRVLSHFSALNRIYEENPEAINVLLHTPDAIPSDVVASYVGFFDDPDEQVQIHRELVDFLQNLVESLPRGRASDPYFLTGSPFLGQLYLETQTCLTKQSTLALLATSGINFVLPRVGTR